jgi:hypothetical protein
MHSQRTRDLLRPHLFPAERILWSGEPKQGVALSGRDALLIPFSLAWGGFALFWNFGVWSSSSTGEGMDWFFRLWGLPFLIVGVYLIIGRFIHDAALRKTVVYGVTDQRVVLMGGLVWTKFSSLDIRRLPKLELTEHRDGTGTIDFEGGGSMPRHGVGWNELTPALGGEKRFFRISNARDVYQMIRKQAEA